jgi:hypothetical protein
MKLDNKLKMISNDLAKESESESEDDTVWETESESESEDDTVWETESESDSDSDSE